jgi:hypothetical protein
LVFNELYGCISQEIGLFGFVFGVEENVGHGSMSNESEYSGSKTRALRLGFETALTILVTLQLFMKTIFLNETAQGVSLRK